MSCQLSCQLGWHFERRSLLRRRRLPSEHARHASRSLSDLPPLDPLLHLCALQAELKPLVRGRERDRLLVRADGAVELAGVERVARVQGLEPCQVAGLRRGLLLGVLSGVRVRKCACTPLTRKANHLRPRHRRRLHVHGHALHHLPCQLSVS